MTKQSVVGMLSSLPHFTESFFNAKTLEMSGTKDQITEIAMAMLTEGLPVAVEFDADIHEGAGRGRNVISTGSMAHFLSLEVIVKVPISELEHAEEQLDGFRDRLASIPTIERFAQFGVSLEVLDA